MEIPALADETGTRRFGAEHRREAGIVPRAAARPLRHAEGDELGVLKHRWRGEEAGIGRVGARPAAFDIIDAGAVERLGDGVLVLYAEIDTLRLRAVTQRRVKEIEALDCHDFVLATPCGAVRPIFEQNTADGER